MGRESDARRFGGNSAVGFRYYFSGSSENKDIFWALAIVLLVLWALGFFAFHIGGGLIHVLTVIALIVVIYRLVTGRRVA